MAKGPATVLCGETRQASALKIQLKIHYWKKREEERKHKACKYGVNFDGVSKFSQTKVLYSNHHKELFMISELQSKTSEHVFYTLGNNCF